jgi:NADPH:quinone reductase
LKAGQTLLVTGAAGGVGAFAVQLAALRGLTVIAVASPEDESLIRSLGAEHFMPRDGDLAAASRECVAGGVDGLIDAALVGQPALSAVRNGGSFVSLFGAAAPVPLRGTRVSTVWIRAEAEQLQRLVSLVDEGRLSLRVATTYGLERAAEAHARLAAGRVRGRLVISMAESAPSCAAR